MTENKKNKHYLIIEGGGFRTGFTSGILDAFLAADFDPFDGYIGISGGRSCGILFRSQTI